MRLSKVKLSGFKSFIDATTFELNGQLNGIVGPNGCGKSNIIDAVRWVMGESSAKQLRGESMTDVIFNGSTSRKPASQASIELIFDNSDGTLGGEWAAFTEISVKRLLDREGQGQYFLNGARCRRRDITDIFLGTGLGPRSYAIIEQGMISKIVESKPEELRVFFEEAANISKYKERRKETETRIDHTRQNLLRLNDVREELGTQLSHLEKQAATAKRYIGLKKNEKQLKYILLTSKKQLLEKNNVDLLEEKTLIESKIQELVAEYNAAVEALHELKSSHQTQIHDYEFAAADYQQAKESAIKAEQQLITNQALLNRQAQEAKEWGQRLQEIIIFQEEEQFLAQQISEEIVIKNAEKEEVEIQLNELENVYQNLEQMIQTQAHSLQEYFHQQSNLEKAIEVAKITIEHEELKQLSLERRIAKHQLESLNVDHSDADFELEAKLDQAHSEFSALEQANLQLTTLKTSTESVLAQVSAKLKALNETISTHKGRLSALETLQAQSLKTAKTSPCQDTPLFEFLQIESTWQKALEAVLAHYLTLPVSSLNAQYSSIEANEKQVFEKEDLGFYVKTNLGLANLLCFVKVAKSVEEALEKRHTLTLGHYFVTPEGCMIGRDWLKYPEENDLSAGILERSQEILTINANLENLELEHDSLLDIIEQHQGELEGLATKITNLETQQKEAQKNVFELEKQQGLREQGRTLAKLAQEKAEQEIEHLGLELKAAQEIIVVNREILESSLIELDEINNAKEILLAEKTQLEKQKFELQNELSQIRNNFLQISKTLEADLAAAKAKQATIQKLQNDQVTLTHKLDQLNFLDDQSEQIAQQQETLNILLLENEHKKAVLEQYQQTLANLLEALNGQENTKEALEKQLSHWRERYQAAEIGMVTFVADANYLEAALQEVLDSMDETERYALANQEIFPEDAPQIEAIEAELINIQQKIERIGPVNLIAIDEAKVLGERKTYLDDQDKDLNEALITLESAITSIDKETRLRFMETFHKVNADFSTLFPRLFGGGEAYLELTSVDALESGVTIIAKPPGKKPGTIHLLSGGEKALTAVALVFAIFNLNPAPFCMLDEVDAPLDEANVGRFGNLLKEMCDKVQFIFITHNKSTMAVADYLIGVTMNEPGCSRLVSVDMQAAMSFVDA